MNTGQLTQKRIPDDWFPAGKKRYINYARTGPKDVTVEIYKLGKDGNPMISYSVMCRVRPTGYQV